MKTYRLLPEAQADIEELLAYIAEDSLEAAVKIDLQLHETFDLLAAFPHIGHHRPDLFPAQYRSFPLYSWLIIYRPDTDPLKIFRVWHGAQRSAGLF